MNPRARRAHPTQLLHIPRLGEALHVALDERGLEVPPLKRLAYGLSGIRWINLQALLPVLAGFLHIS